ncbi:MAG: pseudouridine-5-phosphate glycosidase [Phycisphaerae bacterium]|nr:pseudouridine-5-phosphate glycosidase [Phycisphaerae bacterium]|tara:strand:- start:1118 stop:2110 length:993 start_codon:yes stop_codon:yes gene_type:complete
MERLVVHPEVREALAESKPVVFLETAVTTAGLPRTAWAWPNQDRITQLDSDWQLDQSTNLELARAMSRCVRANGAIPATTVIMDGCWHVGLEPTEVERIATDESASKASVSTAAAALHTGSTAGTTVSGALTAASMVRSAGLGTPKVLATGGIGGVHHGWSDRPDVSADLSVIAETPMTVVSAGIKSIVDVPATGEWLETLGVPILGLGTHEMPCFIAGTDPDAPAVQFVHHLEEAADLVQLHWQAVNGKGGVLLTVPLEAASCLPREVVQKANINAEQAASAAGVTGPARTPFLLSHMAEATEGRSLIANISLLLHNAAVATKLACRLS